MSGVMLSDDSHSSSRKTRVIVHLDLDCFYAQVEQIRLGLSADEPIAVQQWGYILAVNYVARKFGVKRSEFADDAIKKCPQIQLPHVETLGENRRPNELYDRTHQKAILRRYRIASKAIFKILYRMADVVEKASVDEAYLDITEQAYARLDATKVFSSDFCVEECNQDTKVYGVEAAAAFPVDDSERLLCIGAQIAREIRQTVYQELGYTCSVGIATNKLMAKLASPMNKPNGQTLVAPRFMSSFMATFPLRDIRGFGGKLGRQLEALYQETKATSAPTHKSFEEVTAGEVLQTFGLSDLSTHLGQDTATYVYQLCSGVDGEDPVKDKKVEVKSFSSTKAFERSGHVETEDAIEYWVRLLTEEMIWRIEEDQADNHRFPTCIWVHFRRFEKYLEANNHPKQTRKILISQDTTHAQLFKATMAALQPLSQMLPCCDLTLHAKDFIPMGKKSTSISTYFSATTESSVWDDMTTKVKKKNKISSFFTRTSSTATAKDEKHEANATVQVEDGDDGWFCEKCQRNVSETAQEHADYHFALDLSRAYGSSTATTPSASSASSRPLKKAKHGPMDFFLKS